MNVTEVSMCSLFLGTTLFCVLRLSGDRRDVSGVLDLCSGGLVSISRPRNRNKQVIYVIVGIKELILFLLQDRLSIELGI